MKRHPHKMHLKMSEPNVAQHITTYLHVKKAHLHVKKCLIFTWKETYTHMKRDLYTYGKTSSQYLKMSEPYIPQHIKDSDIFTRKMSDIHMKRDLYTYEKRPTQNAY